MEGVPLNLYLLVIESLTSVQILARDLGVTFYHTQTHVHISKKTFNNLRAPRRNSCLQTDGKTDEKLWMFTLTE